MKILLPNLSILKTVLFSSSRLWSTTANNQLKALPTRLAKDSYLPPSELSSKKRNFSTKSPERFYPLKERVYFKKDLKLPAWQQPQPLEQTEELNLLNLPFNAATVQDILEGAPRLKRLFLGHREPLFSLAELDFSVLSALEELTLVNMPCPENIRQQLSTRYPGLKVHIY